MPKSNTIYCNRCLSNLAPVNDYGNICKACGHEVLYDSSSVKITENNFPKHFILYGFLPALVIGFLSYLIIYLFFTGNSQMKQMGTALFFIVPACTGITLGYFLRPMQNVFKRGFTAIGLALALGLVIFSFKMSGLACITILIMIFVLPVYIGTLIGRAFRLWNSRRITARIYSTPIAIFFLFPILFGAIEQHYFEITPVHTVTTQVVVDAPKEIVWKTLRFYEHVKQEPPLLLKLGLPIPIRAIGNHKNIGDITSCEYEGGGFIKKKITTIIHNKELSFDVIEQSLHFEHDLTLKGGSILLSSTNNGLATIVTMKTSYESYVRPNWFWQYNMDAVIKSLHKFVINDIKNDSQLAYKAP